MNSQVIYPDLAGKVAIVTGGSKGVGRTIALHLAKQQVNVVTCARTPLADAVANPSKEELENHVVCDVRDPLQVAKVVEFALNNFGSLDLLVNNAGGSPHSMVSDASANYLNKIILLNLTAPLYFAKEANSIMQLQPTGGVIINIGSVSGTRPSPGTAAYGAAKAGLENLTQSLAVEWAPKTRVNCIVAGPILTEQAQLHFGDARGVEQVAQTIPMGSMASPDDIGKAVCWLSSDQASYITGASLLIHGGGEKPLWMSASNANLTGH